MIMMMIILIFNITTTTMIIIIIIVIIIVIIIILTSRASMLGRTNEPTCPWQQQTLSWNVRADEEEAAGGKERTKCAAGIIDHLQRCLAYRQKTMGGAPRTGYGGRG
ncbi:hypothetical protein ElyMa_005099800 [Elysia marginata]|uniref:Secreted protein n=1 Tax=Elysia marginata TaxID=1093978 RepID=A0AAV4JGZ9_9GAST|nr:hypothetical protein ElyMa_005099800 [Elysia marginata]